VLALLYCTMSAAFRSLLWLRFKRRRGHA